MTAALAMAREPARVLIRVYQLPTTLTEGYCVGVGRPIVFLNVDWFTVPVGARRAWLIEFIQAKRYFREEAKYLVLGDAPELTFTIGAMEGGA